MLNELGISWDGLGAHLAREWARRIVAGANRFEVALVRHDAQRQAHRRHDADPEHGQRSAAAVALRGRIDADRTTDAVFVHKRRQDRTVLLRGARTPYAGSPLAMPGKQVARRFHLQDGMGHTAKAQHPEGAGDHDMAALRFQIKGRRGVQPF